MGRIPRHLLTIIWFYSPYKVKFSCLCSTQIWHIQKQKGKKKEHFGPCLVYSLPTFPLVIIKNLLIQMIIHNSYNIQRYLTFGFLTLYVLMTVGKRLLLFSKHNNFFLCYLLCFKYPPTVILRYLESAPWVVYAFLKYLFNIRR